MLTAIIVLAIVVIGWPTLVGIICILHTTRTALRLIGLMEKQGQVNADLLKLIQALCQEAREAAKRE